MRIILCAFPSPASWRSSSRIGQWSRRCCTKTKATISTKGKSFCRSTAVRWRSRSSSKECSTLVIRRYTSTVDSTIASSCSSARRPSWRSTCLISSWSRRPPLWACLTMRYSSHSRTTWRYSWLVLSPGTTATSWCGPYGSRTATSAEWQYRICRSPLQVLIARPRRKMSKSIVSLLHCHPISRITLILTKLQKHKASSTRCGPMWSI